MSQLKLEQLFRRCDSQGKGFIDHHEFRALCASFEIASSDADIIFADLVSKHKQNDGQLFWKDENQDRRDTQDMNNID